MPAVIACPKCKTKFKLPDKLIGKAIKCTSCGTAFQTKAPAAKGPPASELSQPQVSTAELAELGLDGPLRRQPDIFAGVTPLSRQAPDLLGNLATDPGFAEADGVRKTAKPTERPPDDLSEIFQNPYLSPSTAGKGSQKFKGDTNFQYRSLKLWAWLVTTGVVILCLMTFGITAVAYYLLANEVATDAADGGELTATALYYGALLFGLAVGWFAFYAFTVTMVCIFMYRANGNVRALGATDLKISPGWSVGWWFIPFANLVKPVQSMSEIYRASLKPRGKSWQTLTTPTTVVLWWALWLLTGILGGVEGQVDEEMLGQIGFAALVWGSSACQLFAGIMLIMIVFDISRKQNENAT